MAWRPHIRADGTYSLPPPPPPPPPSPPPASLRAPAPDAVPLSFAIGCPSKYNYAKNTRRLLYPPPGGTRVWSHTATETARLAFDDRFFVRSMSRLTRSLAGWSGNDRFELDSSNRENRTVIARLGPLIAIADSRLLSVIYRFLTLRVVHSYHLS